MQVLFDAQTLPSQVTFCASFTRMVTSSCHHQILQHLNKRIYQLFQRLLRGTGENSTPPLSSVVPIDVHSTWQLLILLTPFRGFWAKPLVMVVIHAVSPWCTLIRYYLTNAVTTGCGRKRHWKSPLSCRWRTNCWLFNQFSVCYLIHYSRHFVWFGNKQTFVIKSLWRRKDLCLSR